LCGEGDEVGEGFSGLTEKGEKGRCTVSLQTSPEHRFFFFFFSKERERGSSFFFVFFLTFFFFSGNNPLETLFDPLGFVLKENKLEELLEDVIMPHGCPCVEEFR
jgi:hypothetical protein